jgi:hypothetical protein
MWKISTWKLHNVETGGSKFSSTAAAAFHAAALAAAALAAAALDMMLVRRAWIIFGEEQTAFPPSVSYVRLGLKSKMTSRD